MQNSLPIPTLLALLVLSGLMLLPPMAPWTIAAEQENAAQRHKPVPYRLCQITETSSSSLKRAKIIITTKSRDMSAMSAQQLAETAYAALQYFDARLRDHVLVNVLLMESCTSRRVALGRAQAGNGTREAWSMDDKSQGPGKQAIAVAEGLHQRTRGRRAASDDDYVAVAKKLGMSVAKVKQLDRDLALRLAVQPCRNAEGTPAMPPSP